MRALLLWNSSKRWPRLYRKPQCISTKKQDPTWCKLSRLAQTEFNIYKIKLRSRKLKKKTSTKNWEEEDEKKWEEETGECIRWIGRWQDTRRFSSFNKLLKHWRFLTFTKLTLSRSSSIFSLFAIFWPTCCSNFSRSASKACSFLLRFSRARSLSSWCFSLISSSFICFIWLTPKIC